MRLDKFLSESTPLSRKEIKKLAGKGAICVNGTIVKKSDVHVGEEDEITVNGEKIVYRKYIYLMMNKPAGYLSATWDKKDPVVVDLEVHPKSWTQPLRCIFYEERTQNQSSL